MGANVWLSIILLIVLGGAIAYSGDRLGHKLGKKKLRLGKLRPRSTATLFTVLAGCVIPLLTLGIVMAISSDVRRWFNEGPQVLRDRDQLRLELGDLQKRRDQLDKEQKAAQAQITVLNGQVKEAKHRVDIAQAEVQKINAQVKALNAKNVSLSARYNILHAQADKARRAVVTAQTALTLAKKNLDIQIRQLATVQRNVKTVNAAMNELLKRDLEIERENAGLEQSNQKLKDDAAAAKDAFEKQKFENEQTLSKTRYELEQVQLSLDYKQAQLADASRQVEAALNMFRMSVVGSRSKPIIFNVDEEVARIPIPAGTNADRAQGYLQSLLKQSRSVADSRGAQASANGMPSAGLFPRGENQQITPEMQEDAVTKSITDSKTDLVMIATSQINVFSGESVALAIKVYPNPVVYHMGDVVAEVRLNGRNDDEVITNQLYDFFKVRLPDRARRAGMIIPQNQDQVFARVSDGVIARLERLIKAADQGARLQAYVMEDTRAGDPLRLEFRIQ